MGSPFRFSKFGRSGMELSELLPGLAEHADEMAVIRSMVTVHNNHEQAIWNFNTGLIPSPDDRRWVFGGLRSRDYSESESSPTFLSSIPKDCLSTECETFPAGGCRPCIKGWRCEPKARR